ncbi:leptin-like [Dunckerocampus dactyliophorus]|uniref:leptin-like n=1 Tax=Dunckerocampus dactyliophorus TaxID=161453 RepID=UPI002405E357|nr:leptin-like [Dunckerocampus dactyliophorus]
MDYITLAVLVSSHMLSVTTAAALPVEAMKMKTKVKRIAEQLVVRLNINIQVPDSMTLTPPTDQPDGLSSVVALLDGYNGLISDSLNISQVKTDISSLKGYLVQWKQGHCNDTKSKPKPLVSVPLQRLQSQRAFNLTVSIEALMRVKELLGQLLQNMDQLEKC